MCDEKYIIITGGGTFNKGAQSMLFVTMNECKKRYPNHKLVLMSSKDYKKMLKNDNIYKLEVFPNKFFIKLWMLKGIYHLIGEIYLLFHKDMKKMALKLKYIYQCADSNIDISGFALSSQFSWKIWMTYILNILNAKNYNIPVYIMPQSFGPFNFKGPIKWIAWHYIKKTLNYAKIVYCREKEGYNLLKNKINTNLILSKDMVLLNKDISLNYVYNTNIKMKEYNIKKKAVAIIPNMKLFNSKLLDELLNLYESIIDYLLKNDHSIYIIRHSYEDIEICNKIKNIFLKNKNVILLSDDINCIEFSNLISQFDFAVASRYHSIVHAYKNNIPCIVLGWATKYKELVEDFSQEKYMFDMRQKIDNSKIVRAVQKMEKNYKRESETIKKKLEKEQKLNLFDVVKIKGSGMNENY